jgi:type VI secretion system protein ImpK
MASRDLPFGSGDSERTIIMPQPGGRRRGGAAAGPPPSDWTPPKFEPDLTPTQLAGLRRGLNPLLSAAVPLLTLATQLRETARPGDVPELQRRVIQALRDFEATVDTHGVARQAIRSATYALCVLLDETVLNTPWGRESAWGQRSLLVTFFGEAWGGERFFNMLDNASRTPDRHIDLIEVLYTCLSLGLRGKYGIKPEGAVELDGIRQQIFQLIRRHREGAEGELSPKWRGAEGQRQKMGRLVPLWVVPIAAAAVLLPVWWFAFVKPLTGRANEVIATVHALAANATGPQEEIPFPASPEPEQPVSTLKADLEAALVADIADERAAVIEDDGAVKVILYGRELFASGSDRIGDVYHHTIRTIGEVLNRHPGTVTASGHTDSVPISSPRFPDNWHLSQARAEAVTARLAEVLGDPERLETIGRAAEEPLDPTNPAAAINRRVEIRVPVERTASQ